MLSLYTTRTQNIWRRVLLRHLTQKNTNMLVSFALGDANFLSWPCTFNFLCVYFFALGSKRKPDFQWNIGCVGSLASGLCVGHVHFIFFVMISFAFGTQRKPVFWWNMGFTVELNPKLPNDINGNVLHIPPGMQDSHAIIHFFCQIP